MKILLTGADGFLGTNITRELLGRGYKVRAFIQPGRPTELLNDLDIGKFEGDILNEEDIFQALEGCDALIHAAANTSIWPSRSEIVKKVNVEGTRNVVNAALKAGIKRMVYIGTANTFGFGDEQDPGHEGKPYSSARYKMEYQDSKYKAHLVVMEAVKNQGLPCIVVNPTFMFGPYDSKPSSGAMIVGVYRGKVPGYTLGGRNFIKVKDAAVGVANALTKGEIGECYILGNVNLTYKEIFEKIARVTGVKAPGIPLPKFLVLAFGLFQSTIAHITKKAPDVTYPMSKISNDKHFFTAAKAVKHLDLPQNPIEEGIQECFDWLKANKYI
ncbi:MAG: NAD-dependent epimerase/dehydratase family protein [Bacteroidales bacterium]|nr:NAD-dependent epimerase/dehydratase family protein [Bacteroidales bacterium]